jgi:DNA end-binding protein Ku
MPGRSLWSGTISFGLVAIPIQLVSAVRRSAVSFTMLHDEDYAPLKRRMLCPLEDRIVPAEEIVRGYEIEPGQYIPMTDDELASVVPERSHAVEIMDFIDLADLPPVYYSQPYYLLPGKGGEKPYRLLVDILSRRERAGLAKFVMHDRQYLVAVQPIQDALGLIKLHYEEEVLGADELQPETAELDDSLKERIKQTMKQMTATFDPTRYTDERRQNIAALLEEKVRAGETVEAPGTAGDYEEAPDDLLAALEESLQNTKGA